MGDTWEYAPGSHCSQATGGKKNLGSQGDGDRGVSLHLCACVNALLISVREGWATCTHMYSCVPELRVIMYAFMYTYDMTLYV